MMMKNKQLVNVSDRIFDANLPPTYDDHVCSDDDEQATHGSSFHALAMGSSSYYSTSEAMANSRFHEREDEASCAEGALAGRPSSSTTFASLEEYLSMPPYQEELAIRDCYSEASIVAKSSDSKELYRLNSPQQIIMSQIAPEDVINSDEKNAMEAAIVSHPHYSLLVAAHMNCHKVGASPEVISQINDLIKKFQESQPSATSSIGADPELDQFMNTYCNMLLNHEQEITKTFEEAMVCCKKLETQLNIISTRSIASGESEERNDGGVTSDDDDSGGEDLQIDPLAEEKEIKEHLMRKYSSYIGNLKQEFSRKKKKGKLPRESRQQLLNWWSNHIKWPYPSEVEKASLAESTGLDQKQINNWFINQRKRHWKPSEDTVAFAHPSQTSIHGVEPHKCI